MAPGWRVGFVKGRDSRLVGGTLTGGPAQVSCAAYLCPEPARIPASPRPEPCGAAILSPLVQPPARPCGMVAAGLRALWAAGPWLRLGPRAPFIAGFSSRGTAGAGTEPGPSLTRTRQQNGIRSAGARARREGERRDQGRGSGGVLH